MSEDDLNLGDEKKSSKMRWIIIGGALTLVLVVAGTLFAMGFFESEDPTGEDVEISESEESEESEESDDSDEASDPVYHPMSPFIVNFSQGDGTKLLQVSITTLTHSPDVVAALEKHDPAIRNSLLLLLSGQEPAKLRTREGKEELRKLVSKEIESILEDRTGKSGIDEIFFTGFVMQ